MIAYLCKRLAWAFLVFLGITAVVFVVVHLSGDPAALIPLPQRAHLIPLPQWGRGQGEGVEPATSFARVAKAT